MEQFVFSWRFARQLALLMVAAIVFGCLLSVVLTGATATAGPAWSAPAEITVRRASILTPAQQQPVLLSNLDCTPLTYRLAASSTMQNGCFTESAFGLMDSDQGVVIFNGTDEGLPLTTFTPHQILAPWTKALDLVALDPVDDGALISLYRNPMTAMQDQRDILTRLTGKKLVRRPDVALKDATGKPLVINPQTLTFSSNGAWLVAETIGGAFVRINLATLAMTTFAPAYDRGGASLLSSGVNITDDGRFAVISNEAAVAFKVYDLSTCTGLASGLQPRDCRSYDYRPLLRQRIGGLKFVYHVRFAAEGLLSFDVASNDPTNSGLYELAPAGSITSFTGYIGLGDSFTSGEGAFDYLDGTDTPDNMCHLSRRSYPLLLAHDLFGQAGGHSAACSGAVIRDVGSTAGSYRGQVKDALALDQLQASQPLLLESVEANFVPGYVAQQRFVQRWQPGIATVSVGGNDIGFGDLLEGCVVPHVSRHASDSTCFNTYEDRLELSRLADRTMPRWTALYKQLKAQAPDMRLYAIGYPQLVSDTGNCAMNVQLNKSELEFAEGMVDYLNQDIRKAAASAGVPYIDISRALAGHRLCEAPSYDVAVNGLTAGKDGGPLRIMIFGHESFHPNAMGQELMEQAILKQIRALAAPAQDPVAPPDSVQVDAEGVLLKAPVSGRNINVLVPGDGLTAGTGRRGASVAIQASGADNGLRPATVYTIRLDGPGGSTLGDLTSDGAGDVAGSFALPATVEPGGHTIDLTGQNQSGETVDIRQPFYVAASEVDADGDGRIDVQDSCPGATNSGQDMDRDGVDDICDPLIGLPPQGAPGNLSVLTTTSFGAGIPGRFTLGRSDKPGTTKRPATPKVLAAHRSAVAKSRRVPWLPFFMAIAVILCVKIYTQKVAFRLQWEHMSRPRKAFIYLLSLLLLAFLLGTALSTSTNNTLSKPKKIETYLSESKLYDHFIAYTTDQAKKANGDTDQSGSVSLSDAAVQDAAKAAFPPKLIEQSVNTFLDGNYAWLEGKTAAPSFVINLSSQKDDFATRVGKYVATYSAGLPVCPDAQTSAQQTGDPLAATCRPSGQSPQQIGDMVTLRLKTTGDFLSDPVVTAKSVNPHGNPQSKPYYEKLQHLPKLYRLAQKLPWILGALSILTAIGVIFLSPERRRGLRRVGIVLLIAGVALVALKFFADLLFRKAEHRVFNATNVGQLQQSLTDFAHRVETSIVRVDLWFGLAFLLLAAIIFASLAATRQKDGSGKPSLPDIPAEGGSDERTSPIILARKRLRPVVKDLTPRARAGEDAQGAPEVPAAPGTKPAQRPKKPRRLIQ